MIVKVASLFCITLITLVMSGFVYSAVGPETQAGAAAKVLADVPVNDVEENCVYARDIKHFEILSDEMVLIHAKFNRYWLNRLSARCVGLRKNMVLRVDRYGSQLCANDHFGAQRSGGSVTLERGRMDARCRLGNFEEIVVEQIAVLKQSLRES